MFTSHARRIGLPLALALATFATAAPTASAQKHHSSQHSGLSVQLGPHGVSFGAHYGKQSKHSSFGISVGYGAPRPYGKSHGYAPHPTPCCAFVPGHYETIPQKVWVPGCSRQVWVPPEFHVWTDECGVLRRRCIAGGVWQTVHDPGYWKTLFKKVWVPGHTQCSAGIHH